MTENKDNQNDKDKKKEQEKEKDKGAEKNVLTHFSDAVGRKSREKIHQTSIIKSGGTTPAMVAAAAASVVVIGDEIRSSIHMANSVSIQSEILTLDVNSGDLRTVDRFRHQNHTQSSRKDETFCIQRVYKKTSPNSSITLYLPTREIVLSGSRPTILPGIVFVDPQTVKSFRIYAQLTLTFRRKHRTLLLELRLRSSPFDLLDVRLIQLFRLDKLNARILMDKLQLFTQATNTTIPFQIQFLSTLHFYGYGSYQSSIGSSHIFGLSQPSTSRSIHLVTDLIIAHLLNDAITFPSGILDAAEIKRHGIDGPLHLYINRKGYHSINVLVITDANLKVIYADARFPGSVHDSAIWMVSPVRKFLQGRFTTAANQRSHIIGDSGFPLEPWLFTPITNPPQGSIQSAFNKRFLSTRNSVESDQKPV